MELTKAQLKERLIDAINIIKQQDRRLFYIKHDMYRMNDKIERLQQQINFDLQTAIIKTQTEKDNLKCIKSI